MLKPQIVAARSISSSGRPILAHTLKYSRIGVAALALSAIKKSLILFEEITETKSRLTGKDSKYSITQERVKHATTCLDVLENIILKFTNEYLHKDTLPMQMVSLIKVVSTNWACRIISELFLSLGSYGYLENYKFSDLYKSALALMIIEGSNDVLCSIIGRDLLNSNNIKSFLSKEINIDLNDQEILDKLILKYNTDAIKKNKDELFCHHFVGQKVSAYVVYFIV